MASPTAEEQKQMNVEEEEQMNAVAVKGAAVNTFADDDEPAGDAAKGAKEMDNQERRKKKKQKEIMMPQREVAYALSFEPMAPLDPEMMASLEAMGLGLDPDLVAFGEELNSWVLAVQEDYKQQIADKGYVSCMVEVNEDEEEEEEEDDYEDDMTAKMRRNQEDSS